MLSPSCLTLFCFLCTDVKRALVGVGLITHERGTYMLDKDFNNMSKFLNR